MCENGLAREVCSTLSLKTDVPGRGRLGQPGGKKRLSGVSHAGEVAGLCRPGSFPMGYLSGRESARSGDQGWSHKVGLMLKASDKSFPLGIIAGVDVVRLSNLLMAHQWYRGAHPECVTMTAKSRKFEVGQCIRPSHHI